VWRRFLRLQTCIEDKAQQISYRTEPSANINSAIIPI
jgi:hypothetical protein